MSIYNNNNYSTISYDDVPSYESFDDISYLRKKESFKLYSRPADKLHLGAFASSLLK